MPISVSCSCGARLKAPDTAAGKRIRCPKCGSVALVPELEPDFELLDDDEPAPARSAAPRDRYRDDDEDDFDDDRPRRSRRDDDDDDRPRPRKKKKGKKKAAKSSLPLILGIGGGVLFLGVVGVVLAFALSRDSSEPGKGGGGQRQVAGGSGATKWQDFDQPEFSIQFWTAGGPPQDMSGQAAARGGGVPAGTKMFGKEDRSRNAGQIVMSIPLPPEVLAAFQQRPDQTLDTFVTAMANGMKKGRMESLSPATVGGQNGRRFVVRDAQNVMYGRAALINQRLYVLITGGTGLTEQSDEITGFFDSFQPK